MESPDLAKNARNGVPGAAFRVEISVQAESDAEGILEWRYRDRIIQG